MASAVYSEAQPRPLSLCVDSLPSSSPFPSPGSSFLPPPTPGAHEFAMKPPPQSARRDSRKASLVPQTTSSSSSPRNSALPASTSPVTKSQVSDTPAPSEALPSAPPTTNGHAIQSAAPAAHLSSDVDETNVITPTPSSINVKGRLSTDAEPNPGSPEVTSTPTTIQLPSPSEFEASPLAATIAADTTEPAPAEPPQPTSPPASQVQSTQAGGSTSRSRPTSMSSQPPSSYTYFDSPISPPNPHRVSASSFGLPPTPELTPTRQAPPSPALSRRVSQAPSTMSNISNRSGDLGNPLSRANSRRSARKSKRLSQLQMSSSPGSGKIGGSPLASPSRGHFFSSPDSLSPSNPGGVNASKRLSSLSQAAVQMSPPPVASTTPRTLIKIRDYGFAPGDPRFSGHSVHGVLVPRPNRIKVLTRRLIESFVNPGQKFSIDEEGKVLWGAESDKRRKRREKEEKEEEERLAKEREEKEKGTLRKASIGSSSGSWGRKSKGKKKGGFGARLSWGWSSTGVDGDGYEDDDSDEWSDSDEEGGDEVGQLGRGDGDEGMSSWDILKRLSTWRSSFNQAHGNSHGGGGGGERATNGMGDPALGNVPTQIDLERNFAGEEDDEDDEGDYHDAQEYEDGEYDEGEYPEGEEEPLYPGLYRAVYAFEPEGTAEMGLVEDQIVKVVGRGGGVGWAVVVCEDDSEEVGEAGEKKVKHALVPESYLEPVQFDHDQDAEMGEAVAT